MKRKIIPYNPKLKAVARMLRKNMTLSEVLLWQKLKNKQLLGYDFDRQRPIGNYIVDFYCKDLRLAIEIDGASHFIEGAFTKDVERQKRLEALGVHFLRFDDWLIKEDVNIAVELIREWILRTHPLPYQPKFLRGRQAKSPPPRRVLDARD